MNNASSFYMAPNKEWFMFYKSDDFGKTLKASDVAQCIVGIEDTKIKTENGLNMFSRMFDTCQGFGGIPFRLEYFMRMVMSTRRTKT